MIDDEEIAETTHPLGENHAAFGDGPDRAAVACTDEYASPLSAAFAGATKAAADRALNGEA